MGTTEALESEAGPLFSKEKEVHSFNMTVRDSYGDLPVYKPLYDTLDDVSITETLKLGPIESLQTLPKTSFTFRVADDVVELPEL